MFYVNIEKCSGCGACVTVCPQRAIDLKEEKAVINHRLCSKCGSCLKVCTVNAIYEEAKKPQFVHITRQAQSSTLRKEVSEMPFGRGRGGFGTGYSRGFGMGYSRGFGMGRGNPYPFCRFYPWLPRRWWAYGSGYTPAQLPPQSYSPEQQL